MPENTVYPTAPAQAYFHEYGGNCSGVLAQGDQATNLVKHFEWCWLNGRIPSLRQNDAPIIASQITLPSGMGCDFGQGGTIMVDTSLNVSGPAITIDGGLVVPGSSVGANSNLVPNATWRDFRVRQVGAGRYPAYATPVWNTGVNTDGVLLTNMYGMVVDLDIHGFRDCLTFGQDFYLNWLRVNLGFNWRYTFNGGLSGSTAGENVRVTGTIGGASSNALAGGGTGVAFYTPAPVGGVATGEWQCEGLSLDYADCLMDISSGTVFLNGHIENGAAGWTEEMCRVTSPAKLYIDGVAHYGAEQISAGSQNRPALIKTTGGPEISIRDSSFHLSGASGTEIVQATDGIAPALVWDNIDIGISAGMGGTFCPPSVCKLLSRVQNGGFESGLSFWNSDVYFNECRNTIMAGAVAGTGSALGTIPTDWQIYGVSNQNGLQAQIVGFNQAAGTIQYRIFGTSTGVVGSMGLIFHGGAYGRQAALKGSQKQITFNYRLAAGALPGGGATITPQTSELNSAAAATGTVLSTTNASALTPAAQVQTYTGSYTCAQATCASIQAGFHWYVPSGVTVDCTIEFSAIEIKNLASVSPSNLLTALNTGTAPVHTHGIDTTGTQQQAGTNALFLNNAGSGNVNVYQDVALSLKDAGRIFIGKAYFAAPINAASGFLQFNTLFYDGNGAQITNPATPAGGQVATSTTAATPYAPLGIVCRIPPGAVKARVQLHSYGLNGYGYVDSVEAYVL
ncbi:MAG TPA: hypothetical protein VMU59_11500 [Caulobacteraceae bacterium]|nr:hypothetical protein [Caulobacteraceae bacterium]